MVLYYKIQIHHNRSQPSTSLSTIRYQPIPSTNKQSPVMPRYLMTAQLKPEKEQAYIDEHDNIYPEVSQGLRAAGVVNLHIWKDRLSLYMFVEMEGGKDLSILGKGSDYRNGSQRIKEWEEKMETDFHGGWTEVREIHSSDNWGK